MKNEKDMEKMTIEGKVREIVGAMGLSYACETWARANVVFDRFRRVGTERRVEDPEGMALPACLYVQPVSGSLHFEPSGRVTDAPACLIAFADAMPFDYRGEEAQRIAERLKGIAMQFIERVNNCGFFVPVEGAVNYRVAFDKLDANLCVVTLEITLRELVGECIDYTV